MTAKTAREPPTTNAPTAAEASAASGSRRSAATGIAPRRVNTSAARL